MTNTFRLSLFFILMAAFVFQGCNPGPEREPEPETLSIDWLQSLSEEQLATRDSDGDGVSDFDEMNVYNSDPLNPDSDGDGLADNDEVTEYGTDPLSADSDGDGLSDGDEVNVYNTDPLNTDTDSDTLTDGQEVNETNTDPLNPDSDGDSLTDGDEVNTHGTDPNSADTDRDGFADNQELEMGTDPLDNMDPAYIAELATINFGFDKSNITEEAATKLSENVELLMGASAFRVRIDAYTDHIGGDQYNLRLSLRRANAVSDFYVNNGISQDRIDKQGLGKAPIPCAEAEMDTDTPGCLKNRRAESYPLNPYPFTPSGM